MKPSDPDAAKLLRWYPRPWRERYGDELLAIARGSVLTGDDASQRKAEQQFTACNLKRGTRSVHLNRRDAGEIEVEEFLAVAAPAWSGTASVGDLSLIHI